jgi:hypothetical protein
MGSKQNQFEMNSIKLNMEKESPFQGEVTQDQKQVNPKNMNQIYDMLQKFATNTGNGEGGHPEEVGNPPVILKENIQFGAQQPTKGV